MFIQRVRVRFQKRGELRTISHLDLMRAFERVLRRTGLPLRTSEGYNPRPRISLPVPLGVGTEGLDEVMEFDLADWVYPAEIERRLREQQPAGLDILSLRIANPKEAARGEEATYRVAPRPAVAGDRRLDSEAVEEFLAREEVLARRIRKGREKVVDIRPFILSIGREGDALIVRIKTGPEGSTRPEEILAAMGFDPAACRSDFRIARVSVKLAN